MPAHGTSLPIRYPGRRFQLWHYTVSHASLVLRSNKGAEHGRRIEILFKMVRRMDLPTLMDDVEITVAAEDEVPAAARATGARAEGDELVVYRVAGRGFVGWVTAGAVFVAEDEGQYHAPSPFDARVL